MGQAEVLKYLKGKGWTRSKTIADDLKVNQNNITEATRKLRKQKLVKHKVTNGRIYWYKLSNRKV